VPKQDPLFGKPSTSVPKSSDLPKTPDLNRPRPVPGPQMYRSGQPPPATPDREILLQFQDSTPSYGAEQAKQSSQDDTRSIQSKISSTRKPKVSRAICDDPLDVQQTILRYLKSSARAPITTTYELANLITNSCANVFDQYSVPDAFQFLDFFERSIGNIVSWFT